MSQEGVYFVGVLSSALGYLSRLEHLNLNDNCFLGASTIPTTFAYLTNLKYLGLAGCCLFGDIPTILGLLTNLKYLDIAENYFLGTVPSELGELKNMIGLILELNYLSGVIPSSLCNVNSLRLLRLDQNPLACAPLCLMTKSYQSADFLSNSTLVLCSNGGKCNSIGHHILQFFLRLVMISTFFSKTII